MATCRHRHTERTPCEDGARVWKYKATSQRMSNIDSHQEKLREDKTDPTFDFGYLNTRTSLF
jgi:hypothetical protein